MTGERRYDPVAGEWRTFTGPGAAGGDGCPFCGGPFEVAVVEGTVEGTDGSEAPEPTVAGSELYPVTPLAGAREVVVYSDDHGAGLGALDAGHVARVVEVWAERYAELGRRDDVVYVSVFQGRDGPGHPHGRIHASPDIPPRARRELDVARAHMEDYGTCVYCDVVARERSDGVRVVTANRSFLAFVPFASRAPFEVHIAPLRHAASLLDLTDPERLAFAEVIGAIVRGYERLSEPYVLSMHQAPTDDGEHQHISHLHLELTPARRPAGPAFINDTAPEDVADRLRDAVGERGDP